MFKTAFSTVACPDWTLTRALHAAGEYGYDGVELRTFDAPTAQFACEPGLTSSDKLRQIFFEAGVRPGPLATSISFDAPYKPPVLGRVFGDWERPVRLVKAALRLAHGIGCPYVRVFGFELPPRESRSAGIARIVERMKLAADAARHSGVRLILENGGSFPTAESLLEILDRVNAPLLGAAYSMPVGAAAGEDPLQSIQTLGQHLWATKIKDFDSSRKPCLPGDGELPVRAYIEALAARDFGGWVVYEWDRAWIRGLAEPQTILPEVARRLYGYAGQSSRPEPGPESAPEALGTAG